MVKIISLCGWAWTQIILCKGVEAIHTPLPPNLLAHYHAGFHPQLHPFQVDESLPLAHTLWACTWGARVGNPSWRIHPELVPSLVCRSESISSSFHLSLSRWIHPELVPSSVCPNKSILSLFIPKAMAFLRDSPPIHLAGAWPFRLPTSAVFYQVSTRGFKVPNHLLPSMDQSHQKRLGRWKLISKNF